MKKSLLFLLGVIVTATGAGIYSVETDYLGVGLPGNNSANLARMPDFPDPVTGLDAGSKGKIHFAAKSPYMRGCQFSYHPETGDPVVDAKPVSQPRADITRKERAFVKAAISMETPHCIGEGYMTGNDPAFDKRVKAIMVDFLKRHGFAQEEAS